MIRGRAFGATAIQLFALDTSPIVLPIIYRSMREPVQEPIYHPTLVGEQFLAHIGVVA
jgi:hypothetical protein